MEMNMCKETRCLKITEKVSFNSVSEVSYVYILSGQKLIKTPKNGPFWRISENLNLQSNSVTVIAEKLVKQILL